MAAARVRIARQRGRLKGWRPLPIGRDIAVVAVEVLGIVRHEPDKLGMRVAVAGRTLEAIRARGELAAESALRKRAVLDPDGAFVVESRGSIHSGVAESDDPLTWPWQTLTFHVPMDRLPAIAGLATDDVYDGE